MIIKIVILAFMLFILFSLFRGLYFLATEKDKSSKKMVKSLSWRIGLSILLFVLLIIANYFGLIDIQSELPKVIEKPN